MRRSILRTMLIAGALVVLPAASAWAQGTLPPNGAPTRAGTEIKNVATATFEDANGNAYTPAKDSVSLTVARTRGVEIAGPAVNPKPESPSTGNWVKYMISNTGNEFDTFKVNFTQGSGITVTGFARDTLATVHTLLSEFNDELATVPVDYSGNNGKAGIGSGVGTPNSDTLTFYIRYNIGVDFDPQQKLVVTVESTEDPATNNRTETTYDPVLKGNVKVTAQEPAQSRLPSRDVALHTYTADFKVENLASGKDFTWAVASQAPVTIRSVTGTGIPVGAGSSGTLTLDSGQDVLVTVSYTIDSSTAAGPAGDIQFTVTSTTDNTATGSDKTAVTVIRPALTVAKEAYEDNSGNPGAPIANNGEVTKDAEFWYKITVTNAGGAEATSVEITDVLPTMLEYVEHKDDASRWKITHVSGTVTAIPVDGDEIQNDLAKGETAIFWIKVKLK